MCVSASSATARVRSAAALDCVAAANGDSLHPFSDEISEALDREYRCHLPGFRRGRPCSHSLLLIAASNA